MQDHWQSALLALTLAPATALAGPTTTTTPEPLARRYFEAQPMYADAESTLLDDESPLDFEVYWKNGLRFRTVDKQFQLAIGGRIHQDWAWFSEDLESKAPATFPFENGTEFRRARLYFAGMIYKNIEFKTQFDFAADATGADFKDVYLGLKHSKQVNVRVGQFKEPFSLDELTSSNYGTFMERGVQNALAPGRSTGAMFHGRCADERISYAVGVFKNENDIGASSGSGEYSFTGRVTGLAVDTNDTIVHLGLDASVRDVPGGMFDAGFRPTSHQAPTLINNIAFPADQSTLLGAEAAVVTGPLWASAEYIRNDIEAEDGFSDATISGYYVSAGYFLTGETRPYKRANGTFTAIQPKQPRGGKNNGSGAWEIALRYGMVDFENLRGTPTLIATDQLEDITVGLNWYWNNNFRIMINYVKFNLDSKSFKFLSTPAGTRLDEGGSVFQMRFSLFL